MGQLARLGSFFAMRSREYLKVPKAEEGRTKILVLRNLRFMVPKAEEGRTKILVMSSSRTTLRPDDVLNPSRNRTRASN